MSKEIDYSDVEKSDLDMVDSNLEEETFENNENPLVKSAEKFLQKEYKKDIDALLQEYPKKKSLFIDYYKIELYDPKFADELLENPDTLIEAIKVAAKRYKSSLIEEDREFDPIIRIFNLPEDKRVKIKFLSSDHMGKLIAIEGLVRQFTTVLPKVKRAHWICKKCGYEMDLVQEDFEQKKPRYCTECKHRDFELDEAQSEFVDYQKLEIQEPLDQLEGGEQSGVLNVMVNDDIVNKFTAGDRIIFTGILRLKRPQKKETVYGKFLECIDVTATKQEYEDVEISEEDEQDIIDLSKDPDIHKKISMSIAPHIYGHEKVKEAIAMQLFGGVKKILKDKSKIRGNIHILLIGDPGVGKSQMLQYSTRVAPKSIYVVGKTASGAGLTASAVKDDFGEGGWTLKAGALVLASGGFAMVDEFDKMTSEDRSSMHEAMEQESYHKDFEIMFSDGTKRSIGKFVDKLIEENRSKVIKGKDCEILPIKDYSVITTDFNKNREIRINRVSRHKAPDKLIEIKYNNGRKIKVTPNHPIFVFRNNRFVEVPAEEIIEGEYAPYTYKYNLSHKQWDLNTKTKRGRKNITLPPKITTELAKLIGYIATEGHIYLDEKNYYAEIGVSNTDKDVNKEVKDLFRKCFKTEVNINIQKPKKRKNATKDLITTRCTSLSMYDYFKENFPELLNKSIKKRIPSKIMSSSKDIKEEFLKGAFRGDGFVDSERFGYITASYKMAQDFQDILYTLNLNSKIQIERRDINKYYKIIIRGSNSKKMFLKYISKRDKRFKKVKMFVKRSSSARFKRDTIPSTVAIELNNILKQLSMSRGKIIRHIKKKHNIERSVAIRIIKKVENKINSLKNTSFNSPRDIRKNYSIKIENIAKDMNISNSLVTYIERNKSSKYSRLLECVKNMSKEKIEKLSVKLEQIKGILESDISFLKIESIETKKNTDSKWTYDVTIEPTRTFITGGLVLHNTVSIAKAGIVTSFKTETSVLAAANPKYGRFDSYKNLAEQIEVPPTLLSRFDLFFVLRDILDEKKDKETILSILSTQQKGQTMMRDKVDIEIEKIPSVKEEISSSFLQKYISYARTKIFPVMDERAIKKLQKFFMSMRKMSQDGRVTVTYRQLEALVRLSEASARVRLSNSVTEEDTVRAINMFKASMEQVGVDPETGAFDIDIIATGQSHSQTSKIKKVMAIIEELCATNKTAKYDDIVDEAKAQNIEKSKVREIVDKLSRSGEIYEPKPFNYAVPKKR